LTTTTVLTAALSLLLACGRSTSEEGFPLERLDPLWLPEGCTWDRTCGDLAGVDCGMAVDGPYYYVEARTGDVVETCGGACMGGPRPEEGLCGECPPRQWTCD
jgi:hypothetical protein